MKLFKKTVLPMLFVALAALVACNDDKDGDDYVFVPLTPAEKAAQINEMQGNYTGKLYYNINIYAATIGDSTNISWTVNAADSTLLIQDFPMKAIAGSISSTEMQEAFLNGGTNPLKTQLYLYRPWGTEGPLQTAYFNIIPKGDEDLAVKMPLTIGGEQKNVTLLFTTGMQTSAYSAYYSVGQFYNKALVANLILKQVVVDGGSTYDIASLFILKGNK